MKKILWVILISIIISCFIYIININKNFPQLCNKIEYIEDKISKDNLTNSKDDSIVEELRESIKQNNIKLNILYDEIDELNKEVAINRFFAKNKNIEKNFIKLIDIKIEEDRVYLKYDVLEFFYGEEAKKAYREDHKIPYNKEVHLGNNFYIRNDEENENTLPLSEEALIIMLFLSEEKYKLSTVDDLVLQFENSDVFYNIYIVDNKIALIEEFYIP